MSGALETHFVQLLGIRQFHGMGRHRNIVFPGLVDNRSINGRRQRFQFPLSVVDPDFDECDFVGDVVLNGPSSLGFSCHWIHHVVS